MAKYGNTFFIQVSRRIFTEEYSSLSNNAKWLYVVLVELEHRFTSGKGGRDYFLRTNKELATDTGMSISTLKRAKSELMKTDLIDTWQSHYIDTKTKRWSERHYTAFKVLKRE